MRLFLAVPMADAIRAELAAMQTRLKAADADVRWVGPNSFHLTLAFLGDVDDSLLAPIEEVCAPVAAAVSPFRIQVRGGSVFPKRGPAIKTVWAGIAEGAETWKAVAQKAEAVLAVFGVAPGNDLVPHVTLGRVKGPNNQDALRALVTAEAATDCGIQEADHMTLVQSFLAPSGATYYDVCSWPFCGGPQKKQ